MNVYLDNAATTKLDEEVLLSMLPYFSEDFGNPSSIHAYGRRARSGIENARKTIAKLLGVAPSEIFFTSGGTEADNMAIRQTIETFGIKHIISSKIEHHAVEDTIKALEKSGLVNVSWVRIDEKGNVDLDNLEELLKSNSQSLVSLMHANNEIGTLLPIEKVGALCEKYNAIFHSDTVQTIGHYKIRPKEIKLHFMACSAHKFHGPKGVGFIFVDHGHRITPFMKGGAQERNMRGGTENIAGIVGLAKALEISCDNLDSHMNRIQGLKNYMREKLIESIPGIEFNGEIENEKSLYTVLNCRFPAHPDAEMLLFNLDILGIAASGGSACSSGSEQGSHVLRGLGIDMSRPSVRFSFSKFTVSEEIDYTVNKLTALFAVKEKIL